MAHGNTVLLGYDTFLTLSQEVRCIWNRKFNFVAVVYVLQRYVSLIVAILDNFSPQTDTVRRDSHVLVEPY